VTESPLATLTEWTNGRATRVLTYLDHSEALKEAGLEKQRFGREAGLQPRPIRAVLAREI
jgi:hypothetical protein